MSGPNTSSSSAPTADPKLPWHEGVVVYVREHSHDVVNMIYEFGDTRPGSAEGLSRAVVLDNHVFQACQPQKGRLRLEPRLPRGTRLVYQRVEDHIVRFEVCGSFPFQNARCLRGSGQHQYECFVDLLNVTLPLPPFAHSIPPGIAFSAVLGARFVVYKGQVAPDVRLFIYGVNHVSLEYILFDACPWPLRKVKCFQREPDYNRKFVPMKFVPEMVLVYLGAHCFLSGRRDMPRVRLGLQTQKLRLVPGFFYVSMVVQSRTDLNNYTHHTLRLATERDLDRKRIGYMHLRRIAERCTPLRFMHPQTQFGQVQRPNLSITR